MAGARRKARVLALQALYEVDSTGHEIEGVITIFWLRESYLRRIPSLPVSW